VKGLSRTISACSHTYERADNRTRKLINSAVFESVHVRDDHVTDASYYEPFDVLFAVPNFEYGDLVVLCYRYSNHELKQNLQALVAASDCL
jgi:hypothetical protein